MRSRIRRRRSLRGARGVTYCVYEGRRIYQPRRDDRPVACYRTKKEATRHLARIKRAGKVGTITWRDVVGQERGEVWAGLARRRTR
jgi:hypothetical protein